MVISREDEDIELDFRSGPNDLFFAEISPELLLEACNNPVSIRVNGMAEPILEGDELQTYFRLFYHFAIDDDRFKEDGLSWKQRQEDLAVSRRERIIQRAKRDKFVYCYGSLNNTCYRDGKITNFYRSESCGIRTSGWLGIDAINLYAICDLDMSRKSELFDFQMLNVELFTNRGFSENINDADFYVRLDGYNFALGKVFNISNTRKLYNSDETMLNASAFLPGYLIKRICKSKDVALIIGENENAPAIIWPDLIPYFQKYYNYMYDDTESTLVSLGEAETSDRDDSLIMMCKIGFWLGICSIAFPVIALCMEDAEMFFISLLCPLILIIGSRLLIKLFENKSQKMQGTSTQDNSSERDSVQQSPKNNTIFKDVLMGFIKFVLDSI